MICSSCGAVNPSGSRFCMSCGTSLEAAPEPEPSAAPSGDQPLQPVELGTVEPSSGPTSEPVDLAPADLGSVDPVSGGAPEDDVVAPPSDPVSVPTGDPVSAEPVSEASEPAVSEPAGWAAPTSAEPTSWGPSVSSPPPAAEPPAWAPPATPPPAATPSWQAPAATPAWQSPAPAAPAPAPAPAPQPMPPPPNPSPGDPFALGAAAQRLDQGAQAAARTALVATAAVMVQGERVEAVTQGRLDGVAAVLTLTDRRLLAINQRDWAPVVTWFNIDAQLDVQAWEDQSGATIVLSAAGRQITVDGITDKQPAYELVARLRARLGR
jgi:hypothetical protein